ncbi:MULTISPECIES: HtaA domain-containing protein [unclassified Streptomyces]|uniref:HtaA domain-containing protein n=1 Tax=unclassified Streptomyces TaxID=2593676 RepID=UPI00203057CA|nr:MULTISPECIES: HtaA domain-containing protein [unclassified Streptomyces]MCM1975558.1 HtaA domain-containing protein [Streptomyces sp. G1]
MTKRPGAVAVTGGALLALLGQGTAAAQDTEVSGGYVSWALDSAELALDGAPRPAWLPATTGTADPETGALDLELGGTTRLSPSVGTLPPLPLADLRLRLDGDSGALRTRTALDGEARELALADVAPGDTVVRSGGVTWTGLTASLTEEGAELLSQWSGREFEPGASLGRLDVTVGTGAGTGTGTGTPEPPKADPAPAPSASAPAAKAPPQAAVNSPELTAGTTQTVTGTGFVPGEVLLVAIDQDTRYQVTADEQGHASREFPVYATAVEGAHTVELYDVSGERRADAGFVVRKP